MFGRGHLHPAIDSFSSFRCVCFYSVAIEDVTVILSGTDFDSTKLGGDKTNPAVVDSDNRCGFFGVDEIHGYNLQPSVGVSRASVMMLFNNIHPAGFVWRHFWPRETRWALPLHSCDFLESLSDFEPNPFVGFTNNHGEHYGLYGCEAHRIDHCLVSLE